jgi:HIT family protein
VIGLEVPHAHVHLVPINSEEDVTHGSLPTKPTEEEMTQIASAIVAHMKE